MVYIHMESFKNPQKESQNGLSKRLSPTIDIDKAKKDIVKTSTELIYGRNDYPIEQQRIIDKYGEKQITNIKIGRTPLPSILTKILNVVSLGAFNKIIQRIPYDDLFHLFCILTLGKV